jgi:hypothetical protein
MRRALCLIAASKYGTSSLDVSDLRRMFQRQVIASRSTRGEMKLRARERNGGIDICAERFALGY